MGRKIPGFAKNKSYRCREFLATPTSHPNKQLNRASSYRRFLINDCPAQIGLKPKLQN
jgi:hypothetical protein